MVERCRSAGRLPQAILVDACHPGMFGGTGETVDWSAVRTLRGQIDAYFVLAGGLNPDNVATAVSMARPDAVDVAGGVESSPGRKDADAVRRFVAAARQAQGQ
jgi:phosphoribosylanthranilate isomerase